MVLARFAPPDDDAVNAEQPSVLIEVSGPNVVIRATPEVDHACTAALAEVINAASDTDTCVVIDPHPIRCDDDFAPYRAADDERSSVEHSICRPTHAELAAASARARPRRTAARRERCDRRQSEREPWLG